MFSEIMQKIHLMHLPSANYKSISALFCSDDESDHWYRMAGKIPSDLPIYNIGGDQDPVGEYGKGIYEVTNWLVDTGH